MKAESDSRLVIAPNWIGDSVMAIPFLRALKRRFPEDRLVVLAPRGPAAILRAEASVDAVRIRQGLLADAAALRRERLREAWLLPNSFRAALAAFLAGVPERIGYATDRRERLLTHAVLPPSPTGHQLRDYDRLLRSRDVEPNFDPPRLTLPDGARRRALEVIERAGLSVSRLALLAPGAAFGPTKLWPAARFGQLADRLRDQGFDCGCAIGPDERDLAARVSAAARVPVPDLSSDLDPVELAALIARARVLISNDSGPAHLAGAVETPAVVFFGPTDPGRTAPVGSRSRVLDRYVFCSPCFLKECPYGHECMKEIGVEDVVRVIEEVLA
ncbi:MAG TPA: lipopolysaccharide heptosyltransferase II [Thermoanaerobaculia bacterium]